MFLFGNGKKDSQADEAVVLGAAEATTAPANTAPEIPASMKVGMDRAQAAISDQQKTERALETARASLRQAEQELAEAQQRLAGAEADAAVDAAVNAGDVRAARKRFIEVRDQRDFGQARVTGLQEHLRAATATTTEAQRALAVEVRNWKRDLATTIVAEVYMPAIESVLDAMRLLAATGTALGINRLLAIPAQAFVCDPSDPVRNLASRQRLNWRDSTEAVASYERLAAMMALLRPLIGEFADGPIPQAQEGDDAA